MELTKLVKGLTPYLTSTVCRTPPTHGTSSEVNTSGETRPLPVEDILSPFLSKIGGLHSLVDNRVHLQQSTGMSAVGYTAFYTHKHSYSNGMKHYGYSRASKEFLTQDRKEVERAVQHSKARQKLLSSEQQCHPKTGVEPVGTVGGNGNPKSKASRKRHNRRQRELYQKRKKAKRAQLAKQAVDEAPGAQLVPSEPMEHVEPNGGSEF